MPAYQFKIFIPKHVSIHDSKAVDERTWQALSTTALVVGVLSGKDGEVGMTFECLIEFGYVDFAPVIETSIEAFQNRLRGKIHFVKQDPFTLLHRLEEWCISPSKMARFCTFNRNIGAKEVHEIRLF